MPAVKPNELIAGPARNQTLTGRVCLFDYSPVRSNGKVTDYADLQLVVEHGPSGTLHIEAWRDQARRLTQIAVDGKILKFTNFTIKTQHRWSHFWQKHRFVCPTCSESARSLLGSPSSSWILPSRAHPRCYSLELIQDASLPSSSSSSYLAPSL